MHLTMAIPHDPDTVRLARRFVRTALSGQDLPLRVVDDAMLVAHELAVNAVTHAAGEAVTVAVAHDAGRVRIEVRDADRAPAVLDEGQGALTWPGLRLVQSIAEQWGVEELDHGKMVWAVLTCADDPAAARASGG